MDSILEAGSLQLGSMMVGLLFSMVGNRSDLFLFLMAAKFVVAVGEFPSELLQVEFLSI